MMIMVCIMVIKQKKLNFQFQDLRWGSFVEKIIWILLQADPEYRDICCAKRQVISKNLRLSSFCEIRNKTWIKGADSEFGKERGFLTSTKFFYHCDRLSKHSLEGSFMKHKVNPSMKSKSFLADRVFELWSWRNAAS